MAGKKLAGELSSSARRALIDRADPDLSLQEQAALLGISRSSLYYQPTGPSPEEVALKHRIDAIYTAQPFYGARRIAAQLAAEGHAINRKTVARYMAEMRLTAIYPGPNLSRRAQQAGIYPYLLRQVTANRPNHVWGIDITYVRLSAWLALLGGGARLVLALRGQLGTGPDAGPTLCHRRRRARLDGGDAGNLE